MAEILRLQSKNPKKLVCVPEASQLVVLKIYGGLFGSSLVLLPRCTEKNAASRISPDTIVSSQYGHQCRKMMEDVTTV